MTSPIGALFGGIVAVILLLLFSGSTFYLVSQVAGYCAECNPCVAPNSPLVGEGYVYVLTTVAGLVSALVIAQLSIAEPGKPPTVATFEPQSKGALTTVTVIVSIYLLTWVITGLASLVVGVMLYPEVNDTLADLGTTWLGLAVAAGYAYFGITPNTPGARDESRLRELRDETALTLQDGDLTLGQKVPNTSEAIASGPITKKVRRDDPEFAQLVSSSNPDIVFKDEQGTSADRMMTSRLSERLDKLAQLVKSEWSGTKLRVTEAWDENDEHSEQALHYEGRAADITTHPVDGGKLGRLGRLAVNAGFDWVYFENTAHVHVSVKKS